MNIPNIETIIAFLRSNGWKFKKSKKSKKYYILEQPPYIESKEPILFRIPKHKGGKEFDEYMIQIGFTLAAIYEWDKFELLNLLSKSLPELESDISQQKKNIQLKEKILTFGMAENL